MLHAGDARKVMRLKLDVSGRLHVNLDHLGDCLMLLLE